ncbi:hypothetical protein BSL84_27450 [Streptomyces sp. TN58]|nr:hypothetical protein BSL84_27450 [Streptomyces sp. TN58]
MGDLEEFFPPDSGVAKGFDDGPAPECLVLALGQVDGLAGDKVLDKDRFGAGPPFGSQVRLADHAAIGAPGVLERLSDCRGLRRGQEGFLVTAVALGCLDQHR